MRHRASHEKTFAVLAVASLLSSGCSDTTSARPGAPYDEAHAEAIRRIEYQKGPFRLSGGWKPSELASADRASSPLEAVLPYLAELTERSDSSGFEELAAAGNLLAALGMADQALDYLERAWRLAPSEARVLNDLGATLLASAEAHPERELEALERFEEALELDPSLLPARFNLALALQRLKLRSQAAQAWESVLEASSNAVEAEPWTAVSTQHLEELAHTVEGTVEARVLLLDNREGPGIREAVSKEPSTARGLLEGEVLGLWAGAVASGRAAEASRWLNRFEEVAALLAGRSGDRFLPDVAVSLRRVAASPEARQVAEHVELYLEGLALRNRDRCNEAEAVLRQAAVRLLDEGNPLGLLAELYAAICASRRSSRGELRELVSLRQRIGDRPYLLLRARIDWMEALRAGVRGEPITALALRRQAAAAFEAAGESEMVSVLQGMMSDNLRQLGETDAAWQMQLEALRSTPAQRTVDARLLNAASEVCRSFGLPRAALRFRNEEVDSARRAGSAVALVDALASRAPLHLELGDPLAAERDLREAIRLAEEIPEEATRQYSASKASLELATLLREKEPQAALAAAEDSLQRRMRSGSNLTLPKTYLERARILRRLGQLNEATASLESALHLLEEGREMVPEPDLRSSYFEASREIFDELLSVQLDSGASPEKILGLLARAQARSLSESSGGAPAKELAAIAVSAASNLPPSSILLVYYRLPDALLCVRSYGGGLSLHRLPPIGSEDLEALRAWIDGLAAGRELPSAAEPTSGLLERLLEPLWRSTWSAGDDLIVVPDGVLGQIPFAAVRDPSTGRPLALDHPVQLAPSVALLDSFTGPVPSAPRSLLALGDSAFDSALIPGYARLPGAAREVRDVAASFPRSEVFVGSEATEDALASRTHAFEVLHFAVHSRLSEEPRFSHLLLAPSEGGDGVLYAHELGAFDLSATRLVVLSSCSSAVGSSLSLEGPLSLARSFLAQGVPEVVATLWPVKDRPAGAFMKEFYHRLRSGSNTAEALASTQAWAMSSGESDLASPSTWAAFQLISGSRRPLQEGRIK